MRHKRAFRKLNRSKEHRGLLLRSMATSLFLKGRITTTTMKAKTIQPVVERLVTLAKGKALHARRQAYSFLLDKVAVHNLFEVHGPRFLDRNGGVTRIVKLGRRHGDATEMAILEFVDFEPVEKFVKEKDRESLPATVGQAASA